MTDVKPRVLLVPGPPPDGICRNGVDSYLDALVGELGDKVDFFFLEDPQYGRAVPVLPGLPRNETAMNSGKRLVERIPASIRLMAGYWRDARRLAELMQPYREVVDLVHVNRAGCETQPIAARMAGFKRIVATVHNLPDYTAYALHPVRRMVERACMSSVTRAVAVCDAVKDAWRNRVGMSDSRVSRIYNGIDPMRFVANESGSRRGEYVSDPEMVIIGICARLHQMKGHAVLLQALAKIKAEGGVKWLALVAGGGPEEDGLNKLAAELGLSEHVRFIGYQRDVPAFMAAIDLHVLPSISLECTPYPLLEAMSAGVPSVVTSIGGMPELINASGGGRVVAPGDADALAVALRGYCADAAARAFAGKAAREYVGRALTAEQMALATLALYKDVASK